MKCPSCDKENPEDAKFCSGCGINFEEILKCNDCDAELALNDSFCSACGKPVEEPEIRGALARETSFQEAVKTPNPTIQKIPFPEFFSHLRPTGRIGRELFIINILFYHSIAFWVGVIIADIYFSAQPFASINSFETSGMITVINYLIFLPLLAFQIVKRLHDRGKPAWHIFLYLIPIWFLVEWFKGIMFEGESSINKYGHPPSTIPGLKRLIFWGILASSAIAILALISYGNKITFREELRIGQCFNTDDGEFVEVVSCNSIWQYKVTGEFFTISEPYYPGFDYFNRLASSRCEPNTQSIFFPSKETWDLGDRLVTCVEEKRIPKFGY